jgi:HD-GYP domain-containing protein (c-di-GMP phosphodiesterase class II)
MAIENISSSRGRRRMFLATIGRLLTLLEGSEAGQQGHAERVSAYAAAIATEMGLSDREVLCATIAGLLHDVGKLPAVSGISRAASERSSGAAHVMAATDFLKGIPGFEDVLPGILAHHEHYDGSGVPRQLKGGEIPLIGTIVAVASDFDTLLHAAGQPVQNGDADPALVKAAFTRLDEDAGRLYHPEVVRALIVSYRHGALRSKAHVAEEDAGVEPAPEVTPPKGADAPRSNETVRTKKPDEAE